MYPFYFALGNQDKYKCDHMSDWPCWLSWSDKLHTFCLILAFILWALTVLISVSSFLLRFVFWAFHLFTFIFLRALLSLFQISFLFEWLFVSLFQNFCGVLRFFRDSSITFSIPFFWSSLSVFRTVWGFSRPKGTKWDILCTEIPPQKCCLPSHEFWPWGVWLTNSWDRREGTCGSTPKKFQCLRVYSKRTPFIAELSDLIRSPQGKKADSWLTIHTNKFLKVRLPWDNFLWELKDCIWVFVKVSPKHRHNFSSSTNFPLNEFACLLD